jgi:hypothetical protein
MLFTSILIWGEKEVDASVGPVHVASTLAEFLLATYLLFEF